MNPRTIPSACTLLAACTCAFAQDAAPDLVSFGAPVAGARLSALRGGSDTTINDMRVRGTTTGNTAQEVQTGTNTITDGAFSNMNGIPVVIQNSGANVLIQNALILNLHFQ